jgi:hypothetical protein
MILARSSRPNQLCQCQLEIDRICRAPVGYFAQRAARDVWTKSFLFEIPIWGIIPRRALQE